MLEEQATTQFDGDYEENDDILGITEYDVSVSPNDFNVNTIVNLMDAGVIKIPGFQRNYVWDIKHASRLIESLLIGIPIPQVFLYEEQKNSFLVIDGQQRLMTIYYFKKKRFPKFDKRVELRQIVNEQKNIIVPDDILNNNEYFSDFNLQLPEPLPDIPNKYNKKNYFTLNSDEQTSFDLKTVRHIIIKQNAPKDGDSVMYEIFNRLNSGGVNLKPQEIRTSMYHSEFYDMLYRINLNDNWRDLLSNPTADIHMKDVEILLRGFAMLTSHDTYRPSMTKFLNGFSKSARDFSPQKLKLLEDLFVNFVQNMKDNNYKEMFYTTNKKFNISIYESIFTALCENAYKNNINIPKTTTLEKLLELKNDNDFTNASLQSTASTTNVQNRLQKAIELL